MIAITDSGANIHPAIHATPTMSPVIMNNKMKSIIPDGSSMESTHIETLQLPGLSRIARQIHFNQKIQTDLLISLGVLCDDGCTITLDKKAMSIQNNGEEIIKGTIKIRQECGNCPWGNNNQKMW